MANSSAIRPFGNGAAASTPRSDTNAIPATGNELETALHLLESESGAFAKSVIVDPAARAQYTRQTKAAVSELLDMVRQRKITPHVAAQTANAMRNQIMSLARSKLTDFGLALSREMKVDGLVLPTLQETYAGKRFGRGFSSLAQTERELVWVDIVHAAGRSNRAVNIRVKWYGMAAGVCWSHRWRAPSTMSPPLRIGAVRPPRKAAASFPALLAARSQRQRLSRLPVIPQAG